MPGWCSARAGAAAFDPKRTVASFETTRPAEMPALCILGAQEVNLTLLVCSFYKWLLAQDWLIADPSAKLACPRRRRRQFP